MASKKRKPQGKASPKPQSDPWLNWCAPAQGADVQWFLAGPEERLGMDINDYLDCIETLYPSEILSSAQRTISDATKGINLPKLENIKVAHVLDVEDEDGTSLSGIPMFENVITKRLTLFEVADKVFSKLEKLKAAWPHQDAVERVKNTAKEFVRFLLVVYKMGQEKITQAKAQGNIEAATKLEKAYKGLCMIELSGEIDTDTERLFLVEKISPERFRTAMRRAFKLDRSATSEINMNSEVPTLTPNAPTPRKRYPTDPEATRVLIEGARRKKEKAYRGDSNEAIMLKMMEEPYSIYRERMLHGRLKGKASGQVRERATPLDKRKAAKNWGKYLSAYIISHQND